MILREFMIIDEYLQSFIQFKLKLTCTHFVFDSPRLFLDFSSTIPLNIKEELRKRKSRNILIFQLYDLSIACPDILMLWYNHGS
ncbi:hypothetical protein BpHYR1_032983 [Brachionus plicatilis]|uniref:Uncharacterized protein n=1 Tax=Brachionus plicatilis TaxID=10195 RepID=A0A3M7REQ1_BRAPC|nr:hypothetical protein BpHYR1_032983 [Brachionus plicatilis]